MQEVGTSHGEAVKVTLFVFLYTTQTKTGPVTFNCRWLSDGPLCVSQGGVTFNMRMPLVSPRENGALCPRDPRDMGHLRGDLGVSEAVWALSC